MADQISGPASVAASLPLFGRERESAALRSALSAALAGRGTLVLVGGEAGIGKTALAEALLSDAADQGAVVLAGHCYDLTETPPYGPWRELLARAPADSDLPVLPAAVQLTAREQLAPDSQEAIIARVRGYLAALTNWCPLILLIEDLHWADSASLDLLRAVGRQAADLPLLLIATYRDDEPTAEDQLAGILPALVRESRATRLTLRPLDATAIGALVAARYDLDDEAHARLVAYLGGRAEGNPLYLGELLRSLEESGTLRQRDGAGWVLGDLAGGRVPPLLRQIIGARVARLGARDRDLLVVAAIIGQTVPLVLWATVARVDEEALASVVGRAVAAHLLAETPDGAGLRFAHALVLAALYEAIPLPRRRQLHRRVAEALLATPSPDPDMVANHLQRAGDPRAVEWLIQAGRRAESSFAFRTAVIRFEAALALLAEPTTDRARRGWVLVYRAQALYYGDSSSNAAALREAMRLAEESHDRALGVAATYRLGFHLTAVGDFRGGIAAMTAGVNALEGLTPKELVWLDRAWGPVADIYGPLTMRLAYLGYCEQARAMARRMQAHAPDNRAEYTLAEAHAIAGEPEASQDAYSRGHLLARACGYLPHVGLFAMFQLHRTVLPYFADDLRERQRVAEESADAFAVIGETQTIESADFAYLPLFVVEGRWVEASAYMEGVLATDRAYRPAAASLFAQIAYARGERARVAELVGRWLPVGPAEEPGGTWHFDALCLQRLAAQQALDDGDVAAAHAWLSAHDRWLAWNGAVRGRADGQLIWALYHRATGELGLARQSARRSLALASSPRQPLTLLAAHRFLGELDTVGDALADARAHLDTALALANACAAPYERALTLLALAELHLGEGQRAGAGSILAEARATLGELQAIPALAHCAALDARLSLAITPIIPRYPARLTAREVEVLRLVAAGKSNRAMAAILSRSERTIERHLENIYRKIDAHSKADATAFAFRHGLA